MEQNNPSSSLDIGKKLRAVRRQQKLSLRELAEKAEVSASLLSQIENGKANPSVRSLYGIAEALSLPVNYFFPEDEVEQPALQISPGEARLVQEAEPGESLNSLEVVFSGGELPAGRGPVVRANMRTTIELQGNVTWSRLTAHQEEGVEFLQICYGVGANSGTRFSRHGGREFGLILTGELLVELGFEKYLLKPGDSIIFDSETPHRLVNAGETPVQAVWIIFKRDKTLRP